ncbi:hypothetical protein [Pseudooceanicola atlanticus]|uniref:hypothetical protein n=1 Tax=Pseudooceanicola atlanticus TaxID=1461694 RepID=UPI003B5988CF
MIDLLKFDITARNRSSAAFGQLKSEIGAIKGGLAGVNDYARRAGRSMRNVGAGMSAAVTAPLAMFGKQAVELFDVQQQAEGAVQQAITSTGGSAGRSLSELKGLASALQDVTTYGDEDILRNVTAPLLTFTKVQGDVFDRAQANVLDMATMLKMDLKSASILAGKALNDPIKGISALSRSGVQFSEAQKKVIKAMVETGDMAGAQSMILDELETQFKGQAAAAADAPLGQWRQLSNAIGDVKEELGREIVPFLKPLVKNVKEAVAWFGTLSPEVKRNIVVIGVLVAAIGPVVGVLGLTALGVSGLAGAFGTLAAAVMANPIVAAIALIAGGAYLIYRNWSGITSWFSGLWARVKDGVAEGWAAIKAKISEYSPEWLKSLWSGMTQFFDDAWSGISAGVAIGWSAIKGLLLGNYSPEQLIYSAWRGIADWFKSLSDDVVGAFRFIWETIKTEVAAWPLRMVDYGRDIVQGLIDGIKGEEPKARQAGGALGNSIAYGTRKALTIESPSRVFMGIGKDIVDGLTIGIRENAGTAVAEMRGIAGTLAETGSASLSFMSSVRDGAKTIFSDVLTRSKSFKSSLAGVLGGFGSKLLNSGIDMLFGAIWPNAKGNVISSGRVTPYASGGVVNGPTYFPMRGGTGLMGEAGPEAIMPLTRVGGKLGVRASGGGRAVSLTYAPVIDARGADEAAVRRIDQQQRRMVAEFEENVHAVLRRGRNRNLNGAWAD